MLYLDEPTIGLDLVVKDNIRKAIREINQKYKTTDILTTHDIEDIEELCNRIIIIDDGKKIYDGSLENLKEKYGVTRKVTMEVKNLKEALQVDLSSALNVSKEAYEVTTDKATNSVEVTFDKHCLSISDVIAQYMKRTEVKDIQIQETELSEIVKEICRHGMEQETKQKEEGMVS